MGTDSVKRHSWRLENDQVVFLPFLVCLWSCLRILFLADRNETSRGLLQMEPIQCSMFHECWEEWVFKSDYLSFYIFLGCLNQAGHIFLWPFPLINKAFPLTEPAPAAHLASTTMPCLKLHRSHFPHSDVECKHYLKHLTCTAGVSIKKWMDIIHSKTNCS